MLFRRTRLATTVLLLSAACCRPAAPLEDTPPRLPYRLVNAMPAFWRMMEETTGRDDAAWLAAYREQIIAPHRDVYGLARGGLDDSSLVRYRGEILRNAASYRSISDSLPARLSEAWTQFVRAFPATKPGPVIYILPAPPSAIGGWVRPLEDHDAVVYGFSLLPASGSDTGFAVRVHHELTHLHHIQVNPQMRRVVTSFCMNRGDHRTPLHELMWIEGLAVHASRQLTPGASPAIVLGSRAAQANEAARAQSARAFRERMDVTDRPTVEAFVYGGTDAVPAQAVNYIGMLIAERLATRLTLPEMARLEGSELHDAIRRELEGIEAAAR